MKNLTTFFQEVKIELSKVIWPNKEDFWGSVVVVVMTLIAFTIFLGLINNIFQAGALKGFERLVFGR